MGLKTAAFKNLALGRTKMSFSVIFFYTIFSLISISAYADNTHFDKSITGIENSRNCDSALKIDSPETELAYSFASSDEISEIKQLLEIADRNRLEDIRDRYFSDKKFKSFLEFQLKLYNVQEYTPDDYDYIRYAIRINDIKSLSVFIRSIELGILNKDFLNQKFENKEPLIITLGKYGSAEAADLVLPHMTPESMALTDKLNKTAAHWAAEAGTASILKRLSSYIDVLTFDSKGLTPLHIGYMKAKYRVVKFFRDKFPDLNIADHKTEKGTPLKSLLSESSLKDPHKEIQFLYF